MQATELTIKENGINEYLKVEADHQEEQKESIEAKN